VISERAIDLEHGVIDNVVFSDEDIYRLELERVFGRCWLFVAHDSMLPNDGAYVSNFMGEDSVIVWRGKGGKIRVFLNKCLHRGNKVCLFDRGQSHTLTCTFHGWTYNSHGELSGVPFLQEAYGGELDREAKGLVEARVGVYGGLIFACWDSATPSLDEYLGELRWYIDHLVAMTAIGGLEVIPGKQKYLMPSNWKLLSENFGSDEYHVPVTHASFFRVLREFGAVRGGPGGGREVSIGYPSGVPHALGLLKTGEGAEDLYRVHLEHAGQLGADAVEWVTERWARMQESQRDVANHPYQFVNGNIFPNFSTITIAPAFEARAFILWHPRGPLSTEVWQWCAVERDAPRSIKEAAVRNMMQTQAAAGLIAPDDHENFERTRDNTSTRVARQVPFDYSMSLGKETSYAGHDDPHMAGLPGLIGPEISEVNQRQFYRYWSHLMFSD